MKKGPLILPYLTKANDGGVFPSTNDRWTIVESYIRENGLVRHQIDSFNDFLDNKLQKMVKEMGSAELNVKGISLIVDKVEIGKPRIKESDGIESIIYPMEARMRNTTYAAPMYMRMTLVVNGEEYPSERVYIGDMPIMVKSRYCNLMGLKQNDLPKKLEDPDDPGGYFIINGSERVVVAQEDLSLNKPIYEIDQRGGTRVYMATIVSIGPGYRTKATVELHRDGVIYVQSVGLSIKLPFPIVMKALGMETDQDIVMAISDDPDIQNELMASLEKSSQVAATIDDARDYIGGKIAIGQLREIRIERALSTLDKYFLPHLGTAPDPEIRMKKALLLGQAIKGVVELYLGRRKPDDKDHMANKRIRLVGDLMSQLFKTVFNQFMQDLRSQLEKYYARGKIPNLATIVRADIMTERIRHALSTGNWVGNRTGVTQMLDRTNYLSTISHLRRVLSSLGRGQPHFEARDLHPTQWGRLCAVETPEGANCGLVKNMALLASVTVGIDEKDVEDMLYEMGVVDIMTARRNGIKGSEVLLNGRLIGIHEDPRQLVSRLREMRRRNEISKEINVAYIDELKEVRVNCDSGRLRRPLLVIEGGKFKLKPEHIDNLRKGTWTWNDLEKNGIIEYLDADEEENALITIGPEDDLSKFTHMEIYPSVMLGAIASIIPFSEHNQSPRNIYEAAMAKQSLGMPASNFRYRMDSRGHLLLYPERPLVTTRGAELVGYSKRPSGQNAVVALISYTGYNMEDAVIINKASVERGMFRSIFYRTYETEEIRYSGGETDKIEIPSQSTRGYKGADVYSHLDEDGIIIPEVLVSSNEVLIGKTSPPRFYGAFAEETLKKERRDSSITVRRGERGIVDRILITENSEGYKLIKVKVREIRKPELGDKFASRHGQKGVVGMVLPMEDMPFTESGIVPDIIINPHGMPSRMTIAQLMEAIAGKISSMTGQLVDATPFEGVDEKTLRDALIRLGFRWSGKEVMYSGITGEKLVADIFVGVIYYQKLHHMVADKIHTRSTGPVQILTRQPTEGRSREGGLRLGEMERDVLIAHGASALLHERLVESSDKYTMYVCEDCGMIAWYDYHKGRPVCPIHGNKSNISKIVVPYAFKLMLQELISLGIYPKLELSDFIEEHKPE